MNFIRTLGLVIVLLSAAAPASAIESLGYQKLEEVEGIEIRRYDEHLLASVKVTGGFKSASNRAFRPLFKFISGDNASDTKIAMTAPVLQSPDVPANSWIVSFVMPSSFDLENIPVPTSAIVNVTAQPATTMAVIEYTGGWGRKLFRKHETKLLGALASTMYAPCGDTLWARHNSPMTPSFWRKNEIMVAICSSVSDANSEL